MDFGTLLSYVSVVVALVAGGGLGLQRSRVAALRGDLEDERGRNKTLRDDVADLKLKDLDKDGKIGQLTSDLRHAEALALREQKWLDLDAHLDLHHQAAMAAWVDIKSAIEALPHTGQP